MDNLIDRKVLLCEMEKLYNKRTIESTMTGNRDCFVTWNDAVYLVTVAPTIEAEPIKHGRWIIKTYPVEHTGLIEISVWECTACGHPFWSDTPYCPICGAKMDGEEREDAD